MENKTKYIIITVVILVFIIGVAVYASDTDTYRLLCENAKTISEYNSCIKLDYAINN